MALGHAIKKYAKFQCREIMRCIVKLNDLEDMVEHPLDGVPEALSSAMRQNELMDIEVEVGRQVGANNTTQFNTDNDTLGLV